MVVAEMQRKLATWSTQDAHRKFDRMLRVIASREWLEEATRKTLTARGAKTAGIDGMTRERFIADRDQYLDALRRQLLEGSYRPSAVRRVYIPKRNGKLRPLGIVCLSW